MKITHIVAPIIATGLLVLSSCGSKNSSPASVSPTQAQQTFSSVNQDLSANISGLNTAPGNKALNSISNLSNVASPFARVRAWSIISPSEIKSTLTQGAHTLREMILKASANERIQDSQPFDFASKVGIYTWSHDQKKFTKTGTSSIIKIDYPTDTTSSTNDAELQITTYTDQQLSDGTYEPTAIDAAIYIANVKQVELKMSAGYDSQASMDQLTLSLYVNPYTITVGFDETSATAGTESFSYTKGSTTLIATSFTAIFASAADKANNNPSKVTGYVQLENVKFDITADGTKAATSSDMNDYIVINVTINGGNAGHVVWVTNSQTGSQDPYIQYNDGTQASLQTVFQDLFNQLTSLSNG